VVGGPRPLAWRLLRRCPSAEHRQIGRAGASSLVQQESEMTKNAAVSRRTVLGGLSAAMAAAMPLRAAFAADLVVGFLYVGPRDDYGYNQGHAEGAAAVKKLAGVKVLEEEKVPETNAVEQSMESMINLDGATLLFPTSFGYYDPYMLKLAAKYPNVTFRHAGGLWQEGKAPKNAGSYFGYIDECQYLSGIVAGYTSKSGKLGFVAAKPIPQVLRNINAFTIGARMVNPKATTQVIFTGEWSMPVKEAEATNTLIDQGIDTLTCHVDSPKVVIETSEHRGIFTCGYHVNQQPLAPKGYLTGAEWNWSKVYVDMVNTMKAGKPIPNFLRGGIKDGFVKTSAYGPAVADATRKATDAVKAKMMTTDYVIFKGPLKDNKGNELIAAGKDYGQTDLWLEKMNWLADGVIGATS
jgi:basic membrane protein A and related proteins